MDDEIAKARLKNRQVDGAIEEREISDVEVDICQTAKESCPMSCIEIE